MTGSALVILLSIDRGEFEGYKKHKSDLRELQAKGLIYQCVNDEWYTYEHASKKINAILELL